MAITQLIELFPQNMRADGIAAADRIEFRRDTPDGAWGKVRMYP